MPELSTLQQSIACQNAKKEYDLGNFPRALELYDSVLQTNPLHHVANRGVRQLIGTLKKQPEELKSSLYTSYRSNYESRADNFYQRAIDKKDVQGYENQRNFKELLNKALENYELILLIDPNDTHALMCKGDIYRVFIPQGAYIALGCYEAVLLDDENNIDALKGKVGALFELGHREEAIKAEKALTQYLVKKSAVIHSPEEVDKMCQEAEKIYNKGALEENKGKSNLAAIQILEIYEKLDTSLLDPSLRARICLGQGNANSLLYGKGSSEALKFYLPASQLDPKNLDIRAALGEAYLHKGHYAEAIPQFVELVKKDPNDTKANIHLGKAYYGTKNYHAAVFHLEIARKNEPKNLEILNALGNAHLRKGQLAQAAAVYVQILKTNPSYKFPLVKEIKNLFKNQGKAFLKEKNYSKACESYKQVLRIDKRDKGAKKNLIKAYKMEGKAYFKESNLELAYNSYKAALGVHGKFRIAKRGARKDLFKVCMALGDKNFNKKNYSTAHEYYKEALGLNQNNKKAGKALDKNKEVIGKDVMVNPDNKQAKEALNKAKGSEPESPKPKAESRFSLPSCFKRKDSAAQENSKTSASQDNSRASTSH